MRIFLLNGGHAPLIHSYIEVEGPTIACRQREVEEKKWSNQNGLIPTKMSLPLSHFITT